MTLLPMENKESILCALKCFEKEKPANIPPILDDYIKQVANNGKTMLPWIHVKPLILCKYNKVMDSFLAEYSSDFLQVSPNPVVLTELRSRVYNTMKRLNGIPFTIQRLCELLENPFRHYTRPDKFLRGLEKVLMVVSTVDPQGNKIHQEDPRFPSQAGVEECSMTINDTLLSPPSSPTIDNLRRQHTSKSSDEDITEDENGEDNEEDEEEEEEEVEYHEGTDGSVEPDHVEDVPSLGDENPSVALSLERTTASAWNPEVNKALASDQAATNSSIIPEGKQDSDQSVDESDDLADGAHICRDEVSLKSRISSPAVGPGDGSATKLSPSNLASTGAVCADMERSELNVVKSIDSINKNEGNKLFNGDTVPPIRQILRPIGQLEAFVQNMAADVSSGIGSSLSSTSVATIASQSERGVTDLLSGSENTLSQPVSESMETDSCSLVPAQKRRASGSLLAPPTTTSSVTCAGTTLVEMVSSEAVQSPIKRRRICSSGDPNHISGSETGGSLSTSLNNSPPIILCNPNRDRESGECLASDTLSTSIDATDAHHTTNEPIGHAAEHQNNITNESTDVSEDVLNVSSASAVRIDMETGEEEGNIREEQSELDPLLLHASIPPNDDAVQNTSEQEAEESFR